MLTTEEADYYIQLPKWIVENNQTLNKKIYIPEWPLDDHIYLYPQEDIDYAFFWEIWQSPKNNLKLSLHLQDNVANIPIFRIDYGGIHKNPEEKQDHIPQKFEPYVGAWLEEPHVHYFIEGYKPLAWAVPLYDDSFPVKALQSTDQIPQTLQKYAKRIHVKTEMEIQNQLSIS